MNPTGDSIEREIATINADGRQLAVSLNVAFDGIEHVGRLWFAEEEWEDEGIPDRGVISGRTTEDVITSARGLTEAELLARLRRATVNKRRYLSLRAVTDDILRKVRYLNQVAVSMRAGLIDLDGAAQEIDFTEHQLHELVARLRDAAGVEESA
ncbi:MAG: hypothetical protein ACHQRL_04020 [Gemmatimonadales bacterium]|jgi:hypothetical protein